MKSKGVEANKPYWIKLPEEDGDPERWVLAMTRKHTVCKGGCVSTSVKFSCLDMGVEEHYDLRKPLEIVPIPDADTLRRYYDVVASL